MQQLKLLNEACQQSADRVLAQIYLYPRVEGQYIRESKVDISMGQRLI